MSDEPPDPIGTQDTDWEALVKAARRWASTHMDQWEKFKFDTPYGVVYVRIARETLYPDDYMKIVP